MTGWVVGSSIRLGRLVLAAALAVLVLATMQLSSAAVDVFPEFAPPSVSVRTESLGLSAAEVESLVTVPLEQDLLNGVPWVDHISSRSVPGLSAIELVFEPGTDIYAARQMVQERMTQIRVLPNVGTPPVMVQPVASTSRVAMIGLSSDPAKLSLVDLSVLARWKVRPRLMGVPGVANVAIYGQRDRQLQIQVDPDKLAAKKVSLSSVIETAGNALWVSPLSFIAASTPGTGGFIESPNQRLAIQHILPITTSGQLAAVPVQAPDGTTKAVRLGDVARVTVDHQPLIGDAVVAGKPSLVLVVQKFPGANTEQVTRAVEDAMASLQPGLRDVTVDTGLYRPATFIETGVHNVGYAGLLALALMLLAVAAFLFSWRVALIAVVTVPLSMVCAAWVLSLRGTTFSSMTLVGFAAAVTVVLDDVVVGVDVIQRRLCERRKSDDVTTLSTVVAESYAQARTPLVYATLVVLLVTVPALFLSPYASAFSRPAVASYALALVASMVVALVVTPTLGLLLLRGERDRVGPLARATQRLFGRGLTAVLHRPRYAAAATALLVVGAFAAVPQVAAGGNLLPTLKDPNLLVHLQALPGTALPEMDRITTAMTREVSALPGVRDVGSHVGRAVASDSTTDVDGSDVWVSLDPDADGPATQAAVSAVVQGYPGIRSTTETYTGERLAAAASTSSGSLVVRVFGQDLQTLQRTAGQVQAAVSGVDGVAGSSVAPLVQQPAAEVVVDLAAAERYGLPPGDIRRAATTMMSGLLVGNLYEKQAVFDVVVQGPQTARSSLTSLQDVRIDSARAPGGQVRLSQVARISISPEPTVIPHEGVARAVDVELAVAGRDDAAVAADVSDVVRGMAMPAEYHAEVLGAGTGAYGGSGVLGFAVAAAIGAFLILQAALRSWRLAAALFLTLPLASVGGVLVAPLAGGLLSVAALAGLVAVLGLATRQALLLYRRCQVLEQAGATGRRAAVLQATAERVVPVVLTALTTAAVLLPAVLLGAQPGVEILTPMAVTVLGGLLTTVPVVLLLLPALYVALSGPDDARPRPPGLPRQATGQDRTPAPGSGRGPLDDELVV